MRSPGITGPDAALARAKAAPKRPAAVMKSVIESAAGFARGLRRRAASRAKNALYAAAAAVKAPDNLAPTTTQPGTEQILPQAAEAASAVLQEAATAPVQAEQAELVVGTAQALQSAGTPAFSWGGYFMALGMLFLIIAVLWFAVRYLRKKGGLGLFGGGRDIQVEARHSLGPKKDLMLVRFLNKRLLLGVTEHHISLLQTEELNQEDSEGNDFTSPEHDRVPQGEEPFGKLLAGSARPGQAEKRKGGRKA